MISRAARKFGLPPVARADARVLVLGSLPGDRSIAAGHYYAHPQNQFWRLLGGALGQDLATLPYEDRLRAIQDGGVALWDVVADAWRTGSSDAAIADAAMNDLAGLLDALPDLRAIAFNGGTAHRHGIRALGALAARYTVVALPSSSPLHTVGIAAKQPAWNRLADLLA